MGAGDQADPMISTAIPASTNAARIPRDGSSGKVETTITHPASNNREPASFIFDGPRDSPSRVRR